MDVANITILFFSILHPFIELPHLPYLGSPKHLSFILSLCLLYIYIYTYIYTHTHTHMEEESKKRRERLQAMRMAVSAASIEDSPNSFSMMSMPLSNPLMHPEPVLESPLPHYRFDYYTDPIAAYSVGERNTRGNNSGRGRGDYLPQAFSTPIRRVSSLSYSVERPIMAGQMEQRMSSTYISHGVQYLTPNQRPTDTQLSGSHSGSWRSGSQYWTPTEGNSGTGQSRSPRPWNYTCGSSPDSCGSSGYSGVRGSPHSHSRGRSWRFRGANPSSGGGRRFHNRDSGPGRQELDRLYVKSMVKDPWRKLKPVVGNILVPITGTGPVSWLPKSISAKKAKIAEPVTDIKPKQNLAEYLAMAFEEAASSELQGEGLIIPSPNDGANSVGTSREIG